MLEVIPFLRCAHHQRREKCEHVTNEDIFGLPIARRDRTVGNFFGGTSNLLGREYAARPS
jgi:hypothetical protein